MKNAYDILGIPHGAPNEQVVAAYRELFRKYEDNPEKIREINEAYDYIVMNSGSSQSSNYSSFSYTENYGDIQSKIKANRLEDAEILLDGIPEANRNSEWYYLKGLIQQKRGWLEEAIHNFAKASSMDPSNNTYHEAYRKASNKRSGGYRTERRSSERNSGCGSCDACDMCCGLLCLDSCCECMGGDCISCC